MLDTTRTAAAAIFAADPTMTDAEREARLAPDFAPTNPEPYDEILSPSTAARILGGRDRHTLAEWAKRGLLVAVRTGGMGNRITGYTASSVRALLAGKARTELKPVPSAKPLPSEPIF